MDWITGLIYGGLGLLGGLTGLISYGSEADNQDKLRDEQLDLMDLEWKQSQNEAIKKANQADVETTLGEAVAGIEANSAIGQIGLNQEAQALQYNQASQEIRSGVQNANAQLAQSGTRGSSALNASAMQAEQQNKSLQTQEMSDRAKNAYNLANAMGNIDSTVLNLQERRDDAAYTRWSYSETGTEDNPTQLDIYNKQRSNYYDANSADRSFLAWANAFFKGASSGTQTAATVNSWYKDWGGDQVIAGLKDFFSSKNTDTNVWGE